jgi:5-methylcytosine-specific restriction endonuclease McrA
MAKTLKKTSRNMSEYWRTEEWAKIKADLITIHGEACCHCGRKTKSLAVHHLNYKNFGSEEPDDLILVCNRCHADLHGKPRNNKKTGKTKANKIKKREAKTTVAKGYKKPVIYSHSGVKVFTKEEIEAYARENGLCASG